MEDAMNKIGAGPVRAAFSAKHLTLKSMRSRSTLVKWLVAGGTALAIAAPGIAANWPQTSFSAAHNSYNAQETTISPSNVSGLQVLWGAGVPGGVTAFALNAGKIYAQGQGGSGVPNLAAIDAASGTTLWTITTGNDGNGSSNATIAVGSGLIFVGCGFSEGGGAGGTAYGGVCAYRPATGKLAWHFANPCDCEPEASLWAPPVYSGGVVYFGYGNGGTDAAEYIVAASATTGDVLWTYVAGTANTLGNAAPTVGNGMVYFTCASNSDNFKGICAVSQSNGSLVWSADTGSTTMGLSLGSNKVLYVNGGSANEFAALNATTGVQIWSVTGNSSPFPVSLAKGIVYATGSDGVVYALHSTTGRTLWSVNMASQSSVSIANGVLYDDQQGSNNPETAAYSVSDGSLLWSSPEPGSTLHPPPIVANGILYITNGACGSVCAYGPSD
jgi:outer membrane protein assembly factor BamB